MADEDSSAEDNVLATIVLPFAIVTLIWGSTWLVIRDQLAVVPASWSVCNRFLAAGIAMFALVVARRQPIRIEARAIALAGLIGLCQFVLNFNFVYRAELFITSGLVAVMYALLIIPNSLLGRLMFGDPISPRFLVGSGIALSGVVLLFVHEYRAVVADPAQVLLGVGLALGGVLSASAANLLQATSLARRVPVTSVLAWAMLLGSVMNAAWAWFVAGPPVFDPRPAYIAGVLYLALAGSVVTFPLYFGLIRRIGAGRAAYSSVLIPVIAMALSTIFENYAWSVLAATGGALTLIGMIVALQARYSRAVSPSR